MDHKIIQLWIQFQRNNIGIKKQTNKNTMYEI